MNTWELYSDHPDFDVADREMCAAWESAQLSASPDAAEDRMVSPMRTYAHVGANDSEPRMILHEKLRLRYGAAYTRPHYFDTDIRGKYLGG